MTDINISFAIVLIALGEFTIVGGQCTVLYKLARTPRVTEKKRALGITFALIMWLLCLEVIGIGGLLWGEAMLTGASPQHISIGIGCILCGVFGQLLWVLGGGWRALIN